MSESVQRLEITAKNPNPIFTKWLECWLADAEKRHARSQFRLRDALEALKSYPLPLATGRECAVLRGFGTTLCRLIDEELIRLQGAQLPNSSASASTFQQDVAQVMETVRKTRKKEATSNPPKLTKKAQKALADEEERVRQVTMGAGTFRVCLLVDTQETNGKKKRTLDQTRSYLETLAIPYGVRRLTVGDFLWIARDDVGNELVLPYIVERKRMDDFASSIRDGRFHEQKHRLRQCGIQNILYLVEDYGSNEHVGLPLETLYQAMANTQIHSGFQIVHTENHLRSMVFLQGMTQTLTRIFKDKVLFSTDKDELKPCQPEDDTIGLLKFRALYEDSARNSQLTVREVFMQQLLQLHSLSLEKTSAIVEEYPTPRMLLDAYAQCVTETEAVMLLANIRCGQLQRPIGQKISKTIYDFYRTDF